MSETYDLIVIGGGSAGLVAAGGAALLGARVALIEKKIYWAAIVFIRAVCRLKLS